MSKNRAIIFTLLKKTKKNLQLTAASRNSGGIPVSRYSTARSGLFKAALSAASHAALGNPIEQS